MKISEEKDQMTDQANQSAASRGAQRGVSTMLQKAEAVIAFFGVEDSYRGVAALMENNFACQIINDDFLLRRGFRPEAVADPGFADFGMKWIVAFTTTRLDADAFTAWVKSIVGPLGGYVEEASPSPCDLLNPRYAQPAAIESEGGTP